MIRDVARSVWEEPRAPGAPARVWRDWAVTAALAATAVAEGVLREDVPWRVVSTVMAVGFAVAVLWRRTHPLAVVAVTFGSVILVQVAAALLDADASVGLYTAALLLLLPYALLRWGSGRELVGGLAVMLTAAGAGIAADWNGLAEALVGLLVLLFPAALGASIRYRARARRREIEQVTLRERGQLARELHDVVAHHVSAIAVRAQAGQVLAASDPAAAVDALRVVEGEASRTLAEMRAMVGVLREGHPADLVPHRGVTELPRLRRDGPAPRITVHLGADLADLSPIVGAAVFRIAQESVTNAVRHARDATLVEVHAFREADAVRVTVHDDGALAHPGRATSGYGLVGMVERAALLGGTLRAGPRDDGGWLVDAVIPVDGRPR